jgi:hypothetical protein
MQKTDFFKRILQYSQNEGFSFLSPETHFADPKRMSGGKQMLIAGMGTVAGLISGQFVISGAGYSDQKQEALMADLRRISEYCDLIGVKLDTGPAILRMLIDADDIPGEALVGRFAMIHERASDFEKYSLVIAKNWLYGNATSGVYLQVLTVFSLHSKARHFIQTYADKCTHRSKHTSNGIIKIGGGLLLTCPWVVDLEDETVTPIQIKAMGIIKMAGGFVDKYKKDFFTKQ